MVQMRAGQRFEEERCPACFFAAEDEGEARALEVAWGVGRG